MQILLVRKHKQRRASHLVVVQHLVELLARVLYAISITAVHNEDSSICALIVVPPELADLVLTTNVPHCEADIFVLNSLDIEANCGYRRHNFAKPQVVQDCGLTSSIQADHDNFLCLLIRQEVKHPGENSPHRANSLA